MRRIPMVVARRCRRILSFALLAAAGLTAAAFPASAQTDVIRGRVTTVEGLPAAERARHRHVDPRQRHARGAHERQGSYPDRVPRRTPATTSWVTRSSATTSASSRSSGWPMRTFSSPTRDSPSCSSTRSSPRRRTQQRVNRNSQTPDVSGTERYDHTTNLPPELQGDIAAMAASLPGVTLIPGLDGAADGFSVLGLGADQNSDDAQRHVVQLGNLPRDAQVSSLAHDVAATTGRAAASAAATSTSVRGSGSNFRTRGMSLVLNTPALEWTDRAAQAVGTEYTNVSLGGIVSGPISYNKSFYQSLVSARTAVARQLRRCSTRARSVCRRPASRTIRCRTFSTSCGSAACRRRPAALHPTRERQRLGLRQHRLHSADVVERPGVSASRSTATGDARVRRAAARRSSASASGDRINWSGGVQARHSGYLGIMLSETQLGVSASRNYGTPYLDLPVGPRARELRSSPTARAASRASASAATRGSSSRSAVASTPASRTRSRGSTTPTSTASSSRPSSDSAATPQDQSSNLLGTFSFNSLADLEAGIPASFTRTLVGAPALDRTGHRRVSLGDSYRRTQDLQIQYGLRVDGSSLHRRRPAFNPDIERAFGRRNDQVPIANRASARASASRRRSARRRRSPRSSARARTPRAVVRGGIGVFANNPSVRTDRLGARQHRTCRAARSRSRASDRRRRFPTGRRTRSNPSSMSRPRAPTARSGTVFADSSPNVTLVRAELHAAAVGPVERVVERQHSRRTLLGERRRHVLAQPESAALVRPQLQCRRRASRSPTRRARCTRSRRASCRRRARSLARRARVARRSPASPRCAPTSSRDRRRFSCRSSPIPHGPTTFGWSAAYTYSHIREQVSGFSSTAGNPLERRLGDVGAGAAPDHVQSPLQLLRRGGDDVERLVPLGQPRTRRRSPATSTATATSTIARSSIRRRPRATRRSPSGCANCSPTRAAATRDCLERQIGHIADAQQLPRPVELDRVAPGVARSREVPHAAARQRLVLAHQSARRGRSRVNGSGTSQGLGTVAFPDQSLLYVRGFDPATQALHRTR